MPRQNIGILEQVGDASMQFLTGLKELIVFVGECSAALAHACANPRKIRWKETFFYMNSCGVDGLPITLLICFLMGLILGFQSSVQMHKYGADTFLPALVGCSIVRELGPLMVAIVATGRCGSAFAAEIGTMKVSEEIDAMVTMGFVPAKFLVVPKMIAMFCMLPLLTVIGDFFGIFGGYLVADLELGMPFDVYMRVTRHWVGVGYFLEGISKSFIFALLITLIGCWRGFETGRDSIAVGRATTSAVVLSILAVVVADAFMAKAFTVLWDMQ